MNEGVPVASAELYSTEVVVKTIMAGANGQGEKRVMQAADFKTVAETTAKFVSVATDNKANKARI